MTDPDVPLGDAGESGPGGRRFGLGARDPAVTLNTALVVYIFVNLLFAIPLVAFPVAFFDWVGLDESATGLGGVRWFGAVLLAWAVSGILVLARPGGRAIFVTTGSLQLTFAAAALLYSWWADEYGWSLWFQAITTLVMTVGAAYLWWARLRARAVLRHEGA